MFALDNYDEISLVFVLH